MSVFDRNMIFGTAIEANIQPDYIRVIEDEYSVSVYICRRQLPHDFNLLYLSPGDLKVPCWQICKVRKGWDFDSGDPNKNYAVKYLYPNGDKSYSYTCDDESIKSYAYLLSNSIPT